MSDETAQFFPEIVEILYRLHDFSDFILTLIWTIDWKMDLRCSHILFCAGSVQRFKISGIIECMKYKFLFYMFYVKIQATNHLWTFLVIMKKHVCECMWERVENVIEFISRVHNIKVFQPEMVGALWWDCEALHSVWRKVGEVQGHVKNFDECDVTLVAGRELRVVLNTNDPDYEHVYSIEALDDPVDDLLYFSTQAADESDGALSISAWVALGMFGLKNQI